MALTRLVFDRHAIPRKEFAELFRINEDFYIAVTPAAAGSHLHSAPFARSSHLIKGHKYNRAMQIAREELSNLKGFPRVKVYTAYSPDDPSYFVSGFETMLDAGEILETSEEKILLLKKAWNKTLAQMKLEKIEVWSH